MVTVVPMKPEEGVKEEMVGNGDAPTVKLVALCTVIQFMVTDIFPVVAPAGTVVVILVVVLALTTAAEVLNKTVLLERVVLKFVPVIITVEPIGPIAGEYVVMVCWGGKGVALFSFWIKISPDPRVATRKGQGVGSKSVFEL